jgi:pectate lyase
MPFGKMFVQHTTLGSTSIPVSDVTILKYFSDIRYLRLLVISSLILLISNETFSQLIAFPGAEGGGRFSVGGRGGKVIEVTNLNDSGEGSLRAAVAESGARTVVFRVSGTIMLNSRLTISQDSITIAGQTAPGDGITIGGHEVFVGANHVIIQHIRFRVGDVSGQEVDAIWGRYRKHIIVDHVSASWGTDEVMSLYGHDSLTVQWSIISESLYNSVHGKGYHGYGGIWGGNDATFHHNLLAHHTSRVPRIAGEGTTVRAVNLDIRNNVMYNWGFNSLYGGEATRINVVANYYKPGPATRPHVMSRVAEPYDATGRWFIDGNYVEGDPVVSADNWDGGVHGFYYIDPNIRVDEPFPYAQVTTHTPEEAYELVLEHAGATLPKRDPIDERIIHETQTGTATYNGSTLANYNARYNIDQSIPTGIIDTQDDVGGWPEMESLPPPIDTNRDGVPDEWAIANGFDINTPLNKTFSPDGYTYLEKYLHSLSAPPVSSIASRAGNLPDRFTVLGNYPNPFNPSTTIVFTIPDAGNLSVRIYDIHGRIVKELVDGYHAPGRHTVVWDGTNKYSTGVASGVYFGVVRYGGATQTIKLQLLK